MRIVAPSSCTRGSRRPGTCRWTRLLVVALGLLVPSVVAAQATAPPAASTTVRVLVAYDSTTGNTEKMAKAVAEGAGKVPATEVVLKRVGDVRDADLLAADAIIVGSPVYNGGMAGTVKAFIDRWPFEALHDKVGAAFVTGGGASSGEELAQMQILSAMLIFRFIVVGGDSALAPFGASAIIEEGKAPKDYGVDAAALDKARALGARVARTAARLRAAK